MHARTVMTDVLLMMTIGARTTAVGGNLWPWLRNRGRLRSIALLLTTVHRMSSNITEMRLGTREGQQQMYYAMNDKFKNT
jgi:hypothetical protein